MIKMFFLILLTFNLYGGEFDDKVREFDKKVLDLTIVGIKELVSGAEKAYEKSKEYIENVDTNKTKEDALEVYMNSLKKLNRLTAKKLSELYCDKEDKIYDLKECIYWSALAK